MSMRLFRSQVPKLVDSIIHILTKRHEYVEIVEEADDEFRKDVTAVLYNYLSTDRRLTDRARRQVEARGEDQSMVYSVKHSLARKERFGLHDEAPGFIVGQLTEALLHSSNVEEIYAQDHEIMAALLPEIRNVMANQKNLQQEVAHKIKRFERESATWEDLYFQVNQRLNEKYQLD